VGKTHHCYQLPTTTPLAILLIFAVQACQKSKQGDRCGSQAKKHDGNADQALQLIKNQ